MPRQGTTPYVGLSPTVPVTLAGIRMLPPVSVPSATTHPPAATEAADPPELPPGIRSGSQGLRAGALTTPAAYSCVTVLPIGIAPAARNLVTTTASSAAGAIPARPGDPHLVWTPAISTMSFTPTGMPCSGPRSAPALHGTSAARGLCQRRFGKDLDIGMEGRFGLGDAVELRWTRPRLRLYPRFDSGGTTRTRRGR